MRSSFRFLISIVAFQRIVAGEFVNLTFDSPDLSHLTQITLSPPPRTIRVGNVADLFPGWTIRLDDSTYTDQVILGECILDVPVLKSSLDGITYSPYFLASILSGHGGREHRISISQIGTVPFWASELVTQGEGRITINDVELPRRQTDDFPNEYAWDVAKFAGREVKLGIGDYFVDIDIIGFNIPEPSEWALLLVGGGVLWWARRKSVKGK